MSSSATTYAPAASVASIGYAAHNALSTETYGSSLVHAVTYNPRLQPNEIKLGTSGAPTSIVSITYNYGTTNNNGNVQSVGYAGGGLSYSQTFGYDALNRLTTSVESGASWSQTNAYDRYGNRWIDLGGGNQSLYFNSSNRITNAGFSYDAAGNLTNDSTQSFAYDAENKIGKVNNTAAYTYDGEGHRVRKLLGENLRFIYGIGGQIIAEFSGANGTLAKEYIYGASGLVATIEPTAVNSNGTRYTTSDHLGTPRLVTNSGAGVVSRHDYMPFGQEVGSGIGGRTTGMGFSVVDGVRQKFTSKERDNETGLDYFNARYYASSQGRFTSSDPILIAEQKLFDPQQWNMYSYTRNNPTVLLDPTGMYVCSDGKRCEQFEKARQEALKSKDADTVRGAKAYGDLSTKKGDKGDNGVYVSFADNLKGDRAGSVSRRDTGIELDSNSPNGLRATLNVTIKSDQAGNEEVVAHEGSHVADYQDFVNAIGADGTIDARADALNITHRQTETRAYLVSIGYAQRGNQTLNFGPCGMTKECKFPPGMMPALRDQQIQDLLNSQYKNLDTRLWPEPAYKVTKP